MNKPNVPLFTKIQKLCKRVEKEERITILFAVENGSRAWRMESANSDYDVRFVFIRQMRDYFTLQPKSDVIERFFDKNGKPCSVGAFIDMVGFDVMKFLHLLANSNPTTIEWLVTDIVYHGKQNTVFKKFATTNFNPASLVYHYQSLCKRNYYKYIKSGNLVSYKKYLYAFRGLANAQFVLKFKKVPLIDFNETINTKGLLPESVSKKLNDIIRMKKSGLEKEIIPSISLFDSYIENFLKQPIQKETSSSHNLVMLEKELHKLIK